MYNEMYKIVSNKNIFKIPKCLLILLIFLLIILIFILTYKVNIYDSYESVVNKIGEDYYVKVYMEYDKSYFLNNNKIYIDNNLYGYTIYKIDKEPTIINDNLYINVYLYINLDKNKKVNNYPLIIKQKRKEEMIFKIILEKIRKELYL